MFKKTITSLNTDKAIKLACAAAHDLDRRMNQGALLILQGLVGSSDIICHGVVTVTRHILDVYQPISRKLKRRLKSQLKKYYKKIDLSQFNKENLYEMFFVACGVLQDRKALSIVVDTALQNMCRSLLEALVVLFTKHINVLALEVYVAAAKLKQYWQNNSLLQIRKDCQAHVQRHHSQWDHSIRPILEGASFQRLYAFARPTTYGVILATAVISTTSNADVADEMKVLIEQKKAEQAYGLGVKHPELMGDPLFDYYFGVAAVDSGNTSTGVFALERALLDNPDNDLVRLELGRAYFAQGEDERAKTEFLAVKKNYPPAPVVTTIDKYLEEIADRQGIYKASYSIFVEAGLGINTNVSAAAAVNNIILPYIGPVALGDSAAPIKSAFGFESIGGAVNLPLSSSVAIFGNANVSSQRYSQVSGYNLNVTNATTGVNLKDGSDSLKIAGIASIAQMDATPIPNTYGGGAEYSHQFSATDSVMLAAGTTTLQYPTQYNAYNANVNILTTGYRKEFSKAAWKPVLDVSLNTVKQNSTADRPDLGRRIYGGAIQTTFLPMPQLAVTVGGGYSQSKYDANDLLYQAPRTDGLYSGNLMLQYKLNKNLSTRLELTYFNNLSNLPLYGYEQWTGAIKLRYDWDSNNAN
ncbi:tetratricopeptide repeat protein [Polynucleobacter sp. MWH-Svant-W18]|uniref:tetratricopeptide repeat protein n=1 Tax=Polynucleobacter sp. MWH-Svant-W18 TaxID=1855909 RepID=UPI001BFDA1CE|nr:tetratricopeptide repeat protein [Polynucleobacter sp. MWH-Svant-W18]QWD77377.1 tetratricopeptide repeat protein [Polynucleobacter sp. MWH-Svant-W18]